MENLDKEVNEFVRGIVFKERAFLPHEMAESHINHQSWLKLKQGMWDPPPCQGIRTQ